MHSSNFLKFLTCSTPILLTGCIVVTNPNSPPPYQSAPYQSAPYQPAPVAQSYVDPVPAPVVVQPDQTPAYQPPPPQAAGVYDADLSPYGHWIIYPQYGRCWIPNFIGVGWRPYTIGHWAYTDDGNCIWVSEGDECNWGGIVYHYGQWALTPDLGWIWVPGTTWAPAWVAWREGGGYCGWAPLPPEACRGDVSFQDADRYCPPDRFFYVDERNVTVVQVNQQIVTNNVTIINRTTNITKITVVNNRVVNYGIPTEHVEHATGLKVNRVRVAEATTPEETRRLAQGGAPVRYRSRAIENVRLIPPALKPTPHPRAVNTSNDPTDREESPTHQPDVKSRPAERTPQNNRAPRQIERPTPTGDQQPRRSNEHQTPNRPPSPGDAPPMPTRGGPSDDNPYPQQKQKIPANHAPAKQGNQSANKPGNNHQPSGGE